MRVSSRAEAEQLVAGTLATMAELEAVLRTETDRVRVGRIREGLSCEPRKTELAGSYLQGLQAIKANAIALARFAPDAVARLKAAHADFERVVQDNQVVLATARAVSESLVRGIADEMNRQSRPQGYGPATAAPARRPAAGSPLVLSRNL
jgi:hypothetical protein